MFNEKYDWLIVGAGISGVVVAEKLARAGKKVLLLEKTDRIGGNCFDYKNKDGVLVSKYGPHIFRTNNEKVWNYLRGFGEWQEYKHKVLSKVENKYLPFPININTLNTLYNLSIKNSEDMDKWLKKNCAVEKELNNFEEVAIDMLGDDLYKKMIYGYSKKQWGVDPKYLDKKIINRMLVRKNKNDFYSEDKYQYQPVGGFTKLMEKMVSNENIDIKFNVDFIEEYDKYKSFDKIIYTGRVDDLYNKIFNLKEDLKYRSLKFKYRNYELDKRLKAAVINYPDLKHKYTRVADYGYIFKQEVIKTVVKYEYPDDKGVPCYPLLDDKNQQMAKEMIEKINKTNSKIFLLGRLANYQYINMDEAVDRSIKMFDEVKSF